MPREVERKYLLGSGDWRADAGDGVRILQAYLSLDPNRSVRIRIAGDDAFITIKGKPERSARAEYEYAIPKNDAAEILENLCLQPPIEKTRYKIQRGGLKWEVDEFGGENRGLIIAEVETEKRAEQIEKPNWIGQDVTDDPRYSNLRLFQEPFSRWGRKH